MQLKLALPKGWLQASTATYLAKAGFGMEDYTDKSRSYRPTAKKFSDLFIKVFHEKDVAIQVAMGNYDLGICGMDWVEELLVKYPSDDLLKIKNLGYGKGKLYVAASRFSNISIDKLQETTDSIRIVSEYPNIAEWYALKNRLKRFQVLPIMGATEVYPPENAELAIVAENSESELQKRGLVPIYMIGMTDAFLIGNKASFEKIDISKILKPLTMAEINVDNLVRPSKKITTSIWKFNDNTVKLALPDGHNQVHTIELLKRAGITARGYLGTSPTCRPCIGIDNVLTKVIRPQDMPLQVANGNFDIAITGKDWLVDHLYKFPSSPVTELLSLKYGKVRIVVAISNELGIQGVDDLKKALKSGRLNKLRIASEYINIADRYARDNHLSPYTIIPTWGASESFLPEDADLLIDNVETGTTIAKHNLKIIDTILESSPSIIGNKNTNQKKIEYVLEALKKGLTN
ncbi:MAG: ATP phosphoribosyltransferase [Chloroflexi bacterium]|nr:ATP phosphoribosyltransferase [Chloroflexota bacterium]